MAPNIQDGLEWDDSSLQLIPRWTREPSLCAIETVCRQQLGQTPEASCTVSFYASGAFNKLYLVTTPANNLLMRVSLPVYPHHKTRGEVATLQWVRENTDIPVPKVVAFDGGNDNEIGFEWILMELMPGVPAYRRWRTMSMEQKTAFAERVAVFQAQLISRRDPRFTSIGTLQPEVLVPGHLVSHEFFMGDHLRLDVPRGPFLSSQDWLSSELNIIILKQTSVIGRTEDEDDLEDARDILSSAQKLLSLLPSVFSSAEDITALWHDDLSLNNILVDDHGAITAVVDWECVSALPIWMATRMPTFLAGGVREEEPKRDDYADEDEDDNSGASDGDVVDNEGKNELYWIHLMDYEMGKLQKVHNEKLEKLWPARPVRESHLKVDFYEAVLQCNAGIWLKKVNNWVDKAERGELVRWADV